MSDWGTVKQRQQQAWATGDFSMIGVGVTLVGELLCEAVELHAGERVLDVATGSGNAALAAARRGCEVTGIDYVPALLDRARERATVERLPATFDLGDAENIPFPDASFDVVLTTFGAMFAPDPQQTARELFRVCRPGGRVGMTNWTPQGLFGGVFAAHSRAVAPPPGLPAPVEWGDEATLRNRLAPYASSVRIERKYFPMRARSARQWLERMQTYFGPTMRAFDGLDADGQRALAAELLGILERFNRSGDGTLLAPAEYLEVVARKPE